MSMEQITLKGPGYYVESDDATALLAIDVVIRGDAIEWFDTVMDRGMHIAEVLPDDVAAFAFRRVEREGGWTYRFLPLTLEIYQSKVQQHLLQPKDFEDEAAMFAALAASRGNRL